MYLSYYGLKAKPFQITTDSKFLWFGEKHREAFATLKYGIGDNKGFLLLTGEVGAGKTTLLNALIGSLDRKVIVARIADPGLDELDFYRLVARAFDFKEIPQNKGDFLHYCTLFLNQAHKAGRKVLLIVDEAQRISNQLLEDIRLLSNIEREDAKLLNIFFVGQSEFNEILLDPANRAIRQRITINYDLKKLTEPEVREYVKHRLQVAGTESEIFSRDAIHEIFLFSGGVPRLINIIGDRALLTGYVTDNRRISPDVIIECAEELEIKAPSSPESPETEESAESEELPISPSRPSSGERDRKQPDTGKGDKKKARDSAAGLHFLYIILIGVLLAIIGYLSDIGNVIHDTMISY